MNSIQIIDNVDLQRTFKISKGKKRRLCESIPKWRYVEPRYTKGQERGNRFDSCLRQITEPFESSTPVEIFEELITPEIYDHIVKETVRRYATTCKNMMDFQVSADE